jgi:serine/threonine-protein kinase
MAVTGSSSSTTKKKRRWRRLIPVLSILVDLRALLVLLALGLCLFEGRLPWVDGLDQALFRAGLYLKTVPQDRSDPLIITLSPETISALEHEPDSLEDLIALFDKLGEAGPSAVALILDEPPILAANPAVAAIEEKIHGAMAAAAPEDQAAFKGLIAVTQAHLFRGQALWNAIENTGIVIGLTHPAQRAPVETDDAFGPDRAVQVAPGRVSTYRDRLPVSALPTRMPELLPSPSAPLRPDGIFPVRAGNTLSAWPLIWKEEDRHVPDLVTRMLALTLKTQPVWETASGMRVGFSFFRTDPAGLIKPRFNAAGPFALSVPRYTPEEILNTVDFSFVRNRPVFIGSDRSPTLDSAALAFASLDAGAVSAVPWQALFLGKALILIILIYLLILVPLCRPAVALFISTALATILILGQMGVHLITDWYLPLALPLIFLMLGHIAVRIRQRVRKRLFDLDHTAQSALFELGRFQYEQSRYDQAFDTLKGCRPDEPVLELLYKLGVSLERKRQFDKASAVFALIADRRPAYRDARDRADQLAQFLFGRTTNGQTHAAPAQNLSRTVLGRYEIERELGRGAMGVVYLGKDPKINRMIAIKTMDVSQTFEGRFDEVKDRFFREAMAAGRLNHPSIVTIYDAGEEQDLAYIAMDYVEGKPLNEFNRPETLLPVPVVFRIMAQVADALDYAHKQQVIHRDIKPGNIIYNPRDHAVKVTDFGIARIADISSTRTGVVVGSPSFMAPEQLKGQAIDGRADIFSLGVTFYQLLTGTLPFKGTDLASLGYQITSVKHTPVSSLRPELPKIADSIIDKALQKNPANRYKTAGGMARSLRTGLTGDALS